MRHKRVLGYARVSSIEQTLGTSLQDQQDVIRREAQKRGVKSVSMYVEAESGIHDKFERREQMKTLLADIRTGDLVLVDKIDRWSRDPEFTYGSIRQILGKGAAFYAVGEDIDPSTDQGDSMLGMRVFMAREEHKRIRFRTVGTRRLLQSKGYYASGLVPYGYRRRAEKGAEKNILVIVEEEAAIVREAFKLCISGYSLVDLIKKHGRNRDFWSDMLHRRTYLGEFRDLDGAWKPAQWPAIIDRETFDQAQIALVRRQHVRKAHARPDTYTFDWWLRDVARCGACGAKMSAAYNARHVFYFACFKKCGRPYVRVDLAEQECSPLVEARLVELRSDLLEAKKPTPAVAVPDVKDRLEKIARRRTRFLDAYGDGLMGRDELKVQLDKLEDERLKLEAAAQVAPPVSLEQKKSVLLTVDGIRKAWTHATPQERRRFVNFFARAVGLEKGEPAKFDWFGVDELVNRS